VRKQRQKGIAVKRLMIFLLALIVCKEGYSFSNWGLGFSQNPVATVVEWWFKSLMLTTNTEKRDPEPNPMVTDFSQSNGNHDPKITNPEWDVNTCQKIAKLIKKENIEELRKFINTTNVNQRHTSGQTWLFYAVGHGKEYTDKVVKFFIELGADVNLEDDAGNIPLQYVNTCWKTRCLLDHTTNTNLMRGFRTAVRSEDICRVELFVQYGTPIDKTIFEQVMFIKDIEAMTEILTYLFIKDGNKTNLNTYDKHDDPLLNNAVQFASKHDRPSAQAMAKILIMNPVIDVNTKGFGGYTPLHWAAERNNEELFRLLLMGGANINEKNNDGLTPLDLASKNYHYGLFYAAKKLGAKRASEL